MADLQQYISALERHVGDQAKSPLFARLASLYLEVGRPKDALRMCDAGLAHYPFYSTGHLVKGRALLSLKLPNEARREFEFVHSWLPTNPTVRSLLSSIPVSEDQILEIPKDRTTTDTVPDVGAQAPTPTPTKPIAPKVPDEKAAATGGDFFSAMTSQAPPEGGVVDTVSATGAPAQTEENVFGLPSEAPTTNVVDDTSDSPGSPFGTMDGFGGGGQPAAVVAEEGFWEYAERMRGELGPTRVRTLDEYLSSPPAMEASTPVDTTPPEESAGMFFGADQQAMENPIASDPVPVVDDAFGGFGSDSSIDPGSAVFPSDENAAGADGSEQSAFTDPTSQFPETPAEITGEGPAEAADTIFGTMEDFGGEVQPADVSAEAVSEEPEQFVVPSGDVAEQPEPAEGDFGGLTGSEQSTDEVVGSGADEAAGETAESEVFSGPDFSGPSVPEESGDAESSEDVGAGAFGIFEGPPMDVPPTAGSSNKIEEFAEKLQDARKITPVIDFSTKVSSSSPGTADETAAGAGFVTPTLAEIYAKQGWFDDAINAYRTLAKTRPAEQDKFEQRIAELEEEKKKAD